MRMQHVLLLLAPFVLVALFHHMRFATYQLTGQRRRGMPGMPRWAQTALSNIAKAEAGGQFAVLPYAGANHFDIDTDADRELAAASEAEGSIHPEEEAAEPRPVAVLEAEPGAAAEPQQAAAGGVVSTSAAAGAAAAGAAVVGAAAVEPDVASGYPAPTLSAKKLLDGSANWLPVPDAEEEAPSDLAWRRAIPAVCRVSSEQAAAFDAKAPWSGPPALPAGCVCPKGRRPYHTILTAQASTYQRWQTLIFYYHFRKAQRANPCTEMQGFTRLLASSNSAGDDLMAYMPTVTVSQLGFDKTRGFQARERPRRDARARESPNHIRPPSRRARRPRHALRRR